MRVGKIGPQIRGLPKFIQRFIETADTRQDLANGGMNDGETESVMLGFAFGMDSQCPLQMRQRIVEPALFHIVIAEIVQSDVVVSCDSQSVRPKRLCVPPVGRLFPGYNRKRRDN